MTQSSLNLFEILQACLQICTQMTTVYILFVTCKCWTISSGTHFKHHLCSISGVISWTFITSKPNALTSDSFGVNPVPHQYLHAHAHAHTHTPPDWFQSSTGPFSVAKDCGLLCSMDTLTGDSKYIQRMCLKSPGMKMIYLQKRKSTP